MNSLGSVRSGGVAGIVFVVLLVACNFITPPPPMIDDPASEYLDYLKDSRTMLMVQASLTVWLGIPLLLFVAPLRERLQAIDPARPVLGSAAAAAFGLGWAGLVPLAMVFGGIAYLADTDLDASLARILFLLVTIGYTGAMALWGAGVLFSAVALLRANGPMRWLGWLGLVVVLVVAAGSLSWGSDGLFVPGQGLFLAYLSVMLYLLLVSIAMVRTK